MFVERVLSIQLCWWTPTFALVRMPEGTLAMSPAATLLLELELAN